MQSRKEKGRAPYTKYGKAPFQYSDAYQNWRVAAIAGKEADRAHWAREHAKRFHPSLEMRYSLGARSWDVYSATASP